MSEFIPPLKSAPLSSQWNRQGLRVELRDGRTPARIGLLTGVLDRTYPRPRVEVIPEGLALGRIETWPLADVALLPRKRQLRALGGGFDPPKGYPLVNKESSQSERG
jgi:hypothetical protein